MSTAVEQYELCPSDDLRLPSYCRMKGTGIGPFGYCAQPFVAPIGGYGAVCENPGVAPGTGCGGGYAVDDMGAG